ncbi:glutamine--fructose-6-phosphate aminotransferase [Pandoraea pnomenusa]|jgi:glucosamine--fructose-6-phosphate aminotransferase (isomerizing)|uniref:Glutamine--fructose-6-phosphate aminotransferase [isomerizing] n=1 Tax=Pandoraea pnomenusa TaxID=93220 RepID=A0A378YQ59_9BURK|nr:MULTISPECIES: glutamine--fructose-6-phosphate transaminase (isomerizing) [Pandoraea]AHB07713.1 glucosamine--fructose-6-phosphate aminotransferase [Pandoraea pnomenusa 3kgm]AHB76090.1 glutamine--fructose-6-phosphate aminotransferase [Pandoraea pnomenusa]AHN75581.1 glutamine--fructose-6-phosphate aminotransferase [Pandoraea pnomenusa]AIU27836.1 glutamine--fructose-6-phosphate aminotransferase [Pandoraea pnomenusa]ANC44963.1 glutamine--fructose-6-phosphate aminotransferase [Pandoraea pnomenusa
MCGIVGAVARRNVVPVLVEGLRRLEYRGYDSCGVAVLKDGAPQRARSVSRVADLDEQLAQTHLAGETGIAHTRWATHGAPVTDNAHPIFSRDEVALVHNGIIENHESLRDELRGLGYTFVSQTDTEVIAHLIHHLLSNGAAGDLFHAVRLATRRLHGAYAIAVFRKQEPHRVVGARAGSPLVVGVGEGENFLASDALALAGTTDQFIYLEEGDIVELTLDGVKIVDRNDGAVEREVRTVQAYTGAVELGPYRHYMQKEIFEQPRAIGDTMEGVEGISPTLFGEKAQEVLSNVDSILILACGTSYYSGMTAKYWLESLAQIPTQVEVASEYRYRDSVPNPKTLVVTISQSGETADTMAALQHAQSLGMTHTLAICNVGTSAMVRQTALHYLTRAGTEIGVASTKAFTTQLTALFLLTLTLAKLRGRLTAAQEADYLTQLRHLPAALHSVLALEPQIIAWAEEFARRENALFLGRGLHYPIALEGALKLKEISYIHAEAYPAGELKHGPLALVTEEMPVVTVAPRDALVEKLKSNMQEVRARGGQLYVFADADTEISNAEGIHVIRMPEHYGQLSPILHVVPLQLLAYHTACARGTDVDKPRNLAKSVTVE